MGKPNAPEPPDPRATAAAQTGTNVATGVANSFLNNVNQDTPNGDLSYDVTGNYDWTDPSTNQTYSIPRFTATQTLSPAQQAIQDQNQGAQLNLAETANTQTNWLQNYLQGGVGLNGAPRGGSADNLASRADAVLDFGDTRDQQYTFGDAGDITRSYGPADDFSSDRARVEEALYGRLQPQLEKDRANIEQRLADQGIRYGSQAYASAMDDYNRQSNDARLGVTAAGGAEQQRMMDMAAQRAGFENAAQQQDYLQQLGRGQFFNNTQQAEFQQDAMRGQFRNAGAAQRSAREEAIFNARNVERNQYLQEQYAARNQPINEITSLLGGSQLAGPSFINTPGSQIASTDYAGIMNANFQNQMSAYNAESANRNAVIGGIFGAAGQAARGWAASDERVKDDVVPIGSVYSANERGERDELPIYEYSYKADPARRRHVGPMAQDVERQDHGAVREIGGVKHIDTRRVMGNILKAA